MQITVIGLGKMGLSLAKQMNQQDIKVNGFDLNNHIQNDYKDERMHYIDSLDVLSDNTGQQVVFLLLPAGNATHATIEALKNILNSGDAIIDFSNSYYKDSIKHYDYLNAADIQYYDCGLSGGVEGALNGACMMLGGAKEVDPQLLNLLSGLCVPGGFEYYPEPGSGHYLKMVHNGIEYGMMQAIAEGLELLDTQAHFEFNLDEVTNNWRYGAIISSALLTNIQEELGKDSKLQDFNQKVQASGEAKWMVKEALDEEVPTPVISLSLMKRNASLSDKPFSNKVLSAMRYNFGGHKE